MIPIALSKQQTLNADPKAIQQINFTGNLLCFIIEEAKKHFIFFTSSSESIVILFCFYIISI